MAKLLMITGLGSGKDLALGKKGAFYNTLREFHKYWDRIDIIVPRINGVDSGTKAVFDNVNLHISSWPLILHPIFFLKKGLEIYKEQKFDLMIVHEFPPFYNGIGARLLWQKIKVPYVLELMHIPGHPKAANIKERIYKLFTRLFIKFDSQKARAIRVINKKEVPEFLRKAGIKDRKLVYIPAFYIDLDTFRPMEVEQKYDLVFAARLEKNKGVLNLIKAIKIAQRDKSDISLLIIGSGSLKKNIKDYIEENDLKKNVYLSGWLETSNDVARAYNSAKIFINPSFNEGGPRVVLEAMACGLPVLTTRVGLPLDVIEDEKNGIFIDWEPEKMSEEILHLLQSNKMQEQFAREGRKIVENFERKEAIKNYADKVKGLIS